MRRETLRRRSRGRVTVSNPCAGFAGPHIESPQVLRAAPAGCRADREHAHVENWDLRGGGPHLDLRSRS